MMNNTRLAVRFAIVSAVFGFAVAASTARSQEHAAPRKVIFTQVLHDIDGKSLRECTDPAVDPATRQPMSPDSPDCKAAAVVTLGTVAARALLTPDPALVSTDPASAQKMAERWKLANEVYKAIGYELTEEQVVLIKARLAAVYQSPVVVGQAFPMLFSK